MLLDSNLIIYASQPAHESLRAFIAKNSPAVSIISIVEVLGYQALAEPGRRLFEQFFAAAQRLPITDAVISRAVQLRQIRRVSLGDALIAATALVNDRTLLTHNVDDFAGIAGLKVIDPLATP